MHRVFSRSRDIEYNAAAMCSHSPKLAARSVQRLSSNTFCGHVQDMVANFDAIFDKEHIGAITTLCVLVLYDLNYTGLRRLSGLKRVSIFSEFAYCRHVKREKVNGILERKMAGKIKKNKAIRQVELSVIGK